MYQIPTKLEFNGENHKIAENGDYRMVLDCFSALNDAELTKEERMIACLIIFYEELIDIEDINEIKDIDTWIKEMFQFFRCNQPEAPQVLSHNLIDWEQDEQMICAAINPIANNEIRSIPYLHWWTFMGYYNSIGKSVLATVVSIRNKIVRGDKMEKWENKFKRENPQYFNWKSKSVDNIKEDEEVKALWNADTNS